MPNDQKSKQESSALPSQSCETIIEQAIEAGEIQDGLDRRILRLVAVNPAISPKVISQKLGAPYPQISKKYWSPRLYVFISKFKGDFDSIMEQAATEASHKIREWTSDESHPHHVKGVSKALEYALKRKDQETQKEIAFANLPSRDEALRILSDDPISQKPKQITVKPLEDCED